MSKPRCAHTNLNTTPIGEVCARCGDVPKKPRPGSGKGSGSVSKPEASKTTKDVYKLGSELVVGDSVVIPTGSAKITTIVELERLGSRAIYFGYSVWNDIGEARDVAFVDLDEKVLISG